MTVALKKSWPSGIPVTSLGEYDPENRAKIIDAVQNLPLYVQNAMKERNYSFVHGPTLPELHPGLSERRRAAGFFAYTIRTIFIADAYYMDDEWYESEHIESYVFHESGHFTDREISGRGEYTSQKPAFAETVRLDRANFSDDRFFSLLPNSKKDPDFLLDFFRNIFLAEGNEVELYAESWAHLNGHTRYGLPNFIELMPNTAAFVEREHKAFSSPSFIFPSRIHDAAPGILYKPRP